VKSCQDVKDILEKLKIKAVTKIRSYLIEQISKFRKPMTNYQIPQNTMLKYNEKKVELFILKNAAIYQHRKEQLIFLINNYDLVLSILSVKSCQDVKDILEKLKIKAVTKIRSYLIEQISKFRKPMTNYQIPQNTMLKYKFFFEFALAHERAVAHEIRNEYVDTMSKVYFSYFKSYSTLLNKMQYEELATKEDLMGHDENSSKSLFHKTSSSLKKKSTVFTIGGRGEVLTSQLEAPILIPHSASKNDERYPYEALFRSEQYALVDNACREYQFICEYFKVQGNHAMDMFAAVLNNTLILLEYPYEALFRSEQYALVDNACREYQFICEYFKVQGNHAMDMFAAVLNNTLILLEVSKFESIVKSFNERWKKSLENINAEVLSSFPSLVTGSTLLQLAFTHLVQYYHRFQDLLSPNVRNQLDNIHYIMVEIKKYKTSF
ncbi:vacuolar protein sorting-associated protein 52 homolog, partial [Diaphorina citri]|uniref:Vacuolar protein sorting-associated protein 52 homolog n=1 Tax=Diaphorina citri TaxID=121845 RepID=A0A3Q0JEL0_DIACI